MNWKRPLAVIDAAFALLFIGLMLSACTPPAMCAVSEVEAEKDSRGRMQYEIDYADGREVKISAVQYNLYVGKTQAPCRP